MLLSVSLRAILLIVALIAGSIALACGDSGGDDPDEPSADEEVDGDPDGDDENGDDESTGDASSDLLAIAEDFGAEEFKIEYTMVTGVAENDGTITIYWKPPDNWRMDMSIGGSAISMLNVDGTPYICSSDDGVEQCLESPLGDTLPVPFLSIFTDPDGFTDLIDTTFAGVDVDRSDRTIAGQDAACYSISGDIEGETGSAEYCFGDSGVLLLLRAVIEGEAEFSLEATSVEDSVSDADLEPPFDVVESPDFP